MPTTTPLTDSINALTTYSNSITGASDTDLSSAVATLVAGYGGGGSISKSEYSFTPTATSYYYSVPVSEALSDILFVHFYDTSAVYTTAGTTYEGIHIGPAMSYYSDFDSHQWLFWRTHASNGSTGLNTYGNDPFTEDGYIKVGCNPKLIAGHNYVLEVYYTTS